MAGNKQTFSWELSETNSKKGKVIHLKGIMFYNAGVCIYIGSDFHLVGMASRTEAILCNRAWEVTRCLFVSTCMLCCLFWLFLQKKSIQRCSTPSIQTAFEERNAYDPTRLLVASLRWIVKSKPTVYLGSLRALTGSVAHPDGFNREKCH